ncbi:hypothetical protein PITC_048710 [Penicillium italicum]|uniref:Uncharacterized protein n=1 Tax=Penicillium italicum TaxID=40296 RepID=A0A0A2KTU1_PENIT|nr:hypothetical protein PITC_048710 [Penicillium italicum]
MREKRVLQARPSSKPRSCLSLCRTPPQDCIISNCGLKIIPTVHKHLLFDEMFRLLGSGGRLAVSDILT